LLQLFLGIFLPFLGTALGAGCVFFVRGQLHGSLQRLLLGFASGVMVAASVWSLLIPAMDASASMGRLAFLPAAVGLAGGIVFLLVMDRIIPHLHLGSQTPEGPHARLSRTAMLVLAVTLHNLPEGMAVGVVLAGMLAGGTEISFAAALALSIGIAIQNFPEGAVISLPLRGEGAGRGRAFLYGVLSGVVEPIGAILALLLAGQITPAMPYLLAFTAGAMLYVVVEELIPEASNGDHSNLCTLGFGGGFILMMILDVALG
jgi:ZIP family zinc transporter